MATSVRLHRMVYRFAWRNGEKRTELYDRECVIISSGAKQSALVEFLDNGQREVVSVRALRKVGHREVPFGNRYLG